MASDRLHVGAVGAGRMGRGIALAFAVAGHEARLIDLKPRTAQALEALRASAFDEIGRDLDFLVRAGVLGTRDAARARARIAFAGREAAPEALDPCDVLFEGVPEILEAKRECFAYLSEVAPDGCIVASTSSSIDPDVMAAMVRRPERFLNAHWLNPAHLMPLVEVAPSRLTDPATTDRMFAILRSVGKVPVNGYVLARIQVLAMNEAARIVEEGVATAEDVDTAVRVGFGLRFAVLGLLEFVDWGGCDILHHASSILVRQVGSERYAVPAIIDGNMEGGRRGFRDGAGFYDYAGVDLAAHRERRMMEILDLLRLRKLMPAFAPGTP